MRQIKFRGRKFDGTIVYGDFVHTVPMSSFPGVVDFEGFVHEVDPESVAQFVGHDKNGREVYEGDTVVLNSDDYPLEYKAHLSGYATGDRGIYISAGQFDKVTLKEAAA